MMSLLTVRCHLCEGMAEIASRMALIASLARAGKKCVCCGGSGFDRVSALARGASDQIANSDDRDGISRLSIGLLLDGTRHVKQRPAADRQRCPRHALMQVPRFAPRRQSPGSARSRVGPQRHKGEIAKGPSMGPNRPRFFTPTPPPFACGTPGISLVRLHAKTQ